MKRAIIREVRAYVVVCTERGADYHNQQGNHWINDLPVANPMSIYDAYKATRTSWASMRLGRLLLRSSLTMAQSASDAVSAVNLLVISSRTTSAALSKARIRATLS